MYRLLLILLSQAVIIVSCGHDSCETTSPSEASLPTAESADGEWRAHEVVHDFTLQLPADVSKSPGRGIDSHYERFVSDLFEIHIDYGRYGFSASFESDSDLVREDTVIDSRKATVSSCSKGMKVHLPFDSCTAGACVAGCVPCSSGCAGGCCEERCTGSSCSFTRTRFGGCIRVMDCRDLSGTCNPDCNSGARCGIDCRRTNNCDVQCSDSSTRAGI